jgi:hypothetical protein
MTQVQLHYPQPCSTATLKDSNFGYSLNIRGGGAELHTVFLVIYFKMMSLLRHTVPKHCNWPGYVVQILD